MKARCIATALAFLLPAAQAATEDDATPPGMSVPATAPQSAPVTPAIAPSTPVIAPTTPASEPQAKAETRPKRADFAKEQASRDARQLADWIVDSDDNKNNHFAIIDKKNARL